MAGLNRDVVQEHRVEDCPADRQQSEQSAVDERHGRHAQRHAEDEPGDKDGAERGGRAGLGRQPAARYEQPEQRHDGQGSEKRREEAIVQRIEVLLVNGPEHAGHPSRWGSAAIVEARRPHASAKGN